MRVVKNGLFVSVALNARWKWKTKERAVRSSWGVGQGHTFLFLLRFANWLSCTLQTREEHIERPCGRREYLDRQNDILHYYYYYSCHSTMYSMIFNLDPSESLRKKKTTQTKGALCTKSNWFLYLLPAWDLSTPFAALSPSFSLRTNYYFYSKS